MNGTSATSQTDTVNNIVIVDDHPLIRRGMRQLFETEKSLRVCGEAASVAHGLDEIKRCCPDLAIIDISLPDGSGFDLIKRLQVIQPNLLILVSSMHDERLLADRTLRAGAKGYVNKQETPDHLIEAVKKILSGKIYLSEEMTERLLQNKYNGGAAGFICSPINALSNREIEVFEIIGEGFSTVKIAEQLSLSVKTIETHRAHIKEKLNISSSSELTRSAVQWLLEGS